MNEEWITELKSAHAKIESAVLMLDKLGKIAAIKRLRVVQSELSAVLASEAE